MIYPFFVSRFGMLHLLVFPYLLGQAKSFSQNLFGLFSFSFQEGVNIQTTSLGVLPYDLLVSLNLEKEFYSLIWLVFLYVGFFLYRGHIKLNLSRINLSGFSNRIQWIALLYFLVVFGFFSYTNGITAWISLWGEAGGRHEATEGLGPILRVFQVTFVVPLLWYLMRGNRVFKQPIFVAIFLLSIIIGFLATGSRSSVIVVLVAFLACYLLKTRKIPKISSVLAAIVAVLLFGLLGQIRTASTFNQGKWSWDDIDFDYQTNLDRAADESEAWKSLGADLATYVSVPERVDFLYGKTYMAAIAFWLPRAIWKDKPHGVGYYTGREIYGAGNGVPPGPIAEAFWNFGFLGVIVLAFLNGIVLSLVSNTFQLYYKSPGVAVIYILIIAFGLTFSSLGLTTILQTVSISYFIMRFAKVI
ncbi:MAG: O-antigen polymerase [Fulvivirga sp.]